MSECRPPDGTPDRTQCWLMLDPMNTGHGIPECALWANGCWLRCGFDCEFTSRTMASWGWRFHSIAHPPGEHQPRETRDE